MTRSPFKTFWIGLGSGVLRFILTTRDKEEVLASEEEQQLEILSQQFSHRETGQGLVPSLELFQHAQENHQFFEAMLQGHSGEVLCETGQVLLSRNIEQALTLA
jgi:hypothetical protein